jgi:hypothetical protein
LSPKEPARFKASLVAKGFSQILGIDYNVVFSLVVKHCFILVFFGIVGMRDLELGMRMPAMKVLYLLLLPTSNGTVKRGLVVAFVAMD